MAILIANYCKIITNYDSGLLQITADLLQIMVKCYHKLRQKIIKNYGSSYFWKIQNYYKLRQVSLQITAAFSVITKYGKFYYKLWQILQTMTSLQITSQQIADLAEMGSFSSFNRVVTYLLCVKDKPS